MSSSKLREIINHIYRNWIFSDVWNEPINKELLETKLSAENTTVITDPAMIEKVKEENSILDGSTMRLAKNKWNQ